MIWNKFNRKCACYVCGNSGVYEATGEKGDNVDHVVFLLDSTSNLGVHGLQLCLWMWVYNLIKLWQECLSVCCSRV